jgi:gliding motility-associated-like protein
MLPFLLAAPALAQLRIVSVSPPPNDLHTTAFTNIRVTFDRALNNAALPTNAIVVWGNLRGRYSGTLNYEAATMSLVFTPSRSFIDGEDVTVSVSTTLRGADNSTLAQSYVWRFLVRTNYGSAVFTPLGFDLESASPLSGVNQEPTYLVPGDFNNDDFIDLAVVHHGANRLTVLRNTVRETAGATLFVAGAVLTTGSTPTRAAAADFNGDNRLDLAVVNFNSNSLQFFYGNGAGQFSAPQSFSTGEHPIDLLAQDFNGDGAIDVAVVMFGIDRLGIFLNNGSGNFTEAQRLQVSAAPVAATAWDYDQDGDLDIVVAHNGAKSLALLRNDGRGNFAAIATLNLPLPPVDLLSGDVAGITGNRVGDGRREILVLCSNLHFLGKNAAPQNPNATSVLAVVNSTGTGLQLAETVTISGYAQAFTLCNVDTLDTQRGAASLRPDRDLDLFYTRFWDSRVSWLRNPDNQAFSTARAADLDSVLSAKAITHFDIDRDGDNDLAVSNFTQNQLVVYLNQGSRIPPCSPSDSLGTSVSVVDFGEVWVRRTGSRRLFVNNSSTLDFSFTTALTDSVQFGVSPRRGVLPSGRPLALNATFTPSDTLPYQSTLLISTNDILATTACNVILRGRGVRATIVADSVLDFGCVPPGQTANRVLRIANSGNIPLVISGAANSTPYFTTRLNLTNQQIAPRTFLDVPMAFTPNQLGEFLDSLKISSNDLDHPVATVYLRGCSSSNGPTITSNDTLYATEDMLAVYVATATDPDGTTPVFRFENLPNWLQAFSDTVRGTPREGDGNTFFDVIASDGFFADSLRVIVIVTPVNDAPVFDPISDQTVFERDRLTFDVVARDPENTPLVLQAQNLPAGATFADRGGGSGQFSWRPDFGTAGEYAVTFVAREQSGTPPLTGSITAKITVRKRQPDLYVASLSAGSLPVRLNQIVNAIAVFADSSAPAEEPFTARLLFDGQILADTVITSLQAGATVTLSRPLQFTALGHHTLQAIVDVNNAITESNENNNSQFLEFDVQPGQLNVAPNPFTPNADGFNDQVVFELSDLAVQSPQLKIFDLRGNLLATISQPQASQFRWDGNDRSGRQQPPGPYLYLLLDGDRKIASGYVVLAR